MGNKDSYSHRTGVSTFAMRTSQRTDRKLQNKISRSPKNQIKQYLHPTPQKNPLMKKIRIAVAEDQEMFRSGLVSLLRRIKGVEVVIEAVNGKDLITKMRGASVDLVFLDYRMPELNGIETAKIIREGSSETRIIMLSSYNDEEIIMHAFANGANGYLTKDDSEAEMTLAIESVMRDGYYFNERTSKLLIVNMTLQDKVSPKFSSGAGEIKFSVQEISVIKLLAKENSTSEIAKMMVKSERTIDSYRASIMKKTGTKNLAGIVMYGVKYGIIDV